MNMIGIYLHSYTLHFIVDLIVLSQEQKLDTQLLPQKQMYGLEMEIELM
jgi:hypothetical protein